MMLKTLHAGRGMAALAVVAYHANISAEYFAKGAGGFVQTIASYGYFGVDFFFVLSGFVLTIAHAGDRWGVADFSRYIGSRARRIYLPYLPVGIGLAAIYVAIPHLTEGERQWQWLPSLTLLPLGAPAALSVAWTLQHELLFYLVFGLAMLAGRLVPVLAAWAALICIDRFSGAPTGVLLAPINLAFVAGALAGIVFLRSPKARLVEQSVDIPRAFLALGTISYSLYLTHGPVISVVSRICRGAEWSMVMLASISAAVAAALCYHLLWERHVCHASKRSERKPTFVATAYRHGSASG